MKTEQSELISTTSASAQTDGKPKDHLSAGDLTAKQRILIMLPLLLGGFASLLNETILNVAFPPLMESLHVSMGTVQWLATAYMLIIGVSVPVAAFLLKTFSTRKLYLGAMTFFLVGSFCCGFSVNFPMLLLSRMIQGAGTGMMLPIMFDTIMHIFPPSKRGTAVGICAMVIVAAPGIGPTLGGIILHRMEWNWLFFSLIPVAVISMILGAIFLRTFSELTRPKLDIPSVILSTLGFGGLIFGICAVENLGLMNMTVLLSLACGIIGLILFTHRQFCLPQPMLELRTFRFPLFSLGVVILFIVFMLPFAINIILPTYMQSVLGISVAISGLALLPSCIVHIFVAPLSGRIYDRVGARLPLFLGFLALIVSMFLLARIDRGTSLLTLIVLQSLMTVGLGLTFTPAQTNTLNQLPPEYMAHGVAITNTMQQIAAAYGSSLFIGLLGAVEAKRLSSIPNPTHLQETQALIAGANVAFTAALILVIIGFVLALFLKQRHSSTSEA